MVSAENFLEENRQNYISSVEKMVKADESPLFAESRFRQMAVVYIHFYWSVYYYYFSINQFFLIFLLLSRRNLRCLCPSLRALIYDL